jgi:protocatechuate 3,4-dioxygenase beta subunit
MAGEDNVPSKIDNVGGAKPFYEYKNRKSLKKKTQYNADGVLQSNRKINKLDPADNEFLLVPSDVQQKLKCQITPVLKSPLLSIPARISKSNNLRRKTASALVAGGDIMYIKGQLRDVNCVPVANAIIELWHNNAFGLNQNNLPKYTKNYDKNFVGSGTTITDNLGNFEFISIFPSGKEPNAPQLNLRVRHKDFIDVDMVVYFSSVNYNKYDPKLRKISAADQALLIADVVPVNTQNIEEGSYVLPIITLNGILPYTQF